MCKREPQIDPRPADPQPDTSSTCPEKSRSSSPCKRPPVGSQILDASGPGDLEAHDNGEALATAARRSRFECRFETPPVAELKYTLGRARPSCGDGAMTSVRLRRVIAG